MLDAFEKVLGAYHIPCTILLSIGDLNIYITLQKGPLGTGNWELGTGNWELASGKWKVERNKEQIDQQPQ